VNAGTLDRKNAILLVAGVSAILLLKFVVLADHTSAPVVAAAESVPLAEKRLQKLREIAATVPARETLLKQATAELETREKGILKADTGAQAHAQLQEKLHRLGEANGIDIRGMEDARVRPLGSDYGEATVYVRFSCRIEQLVNLLAALANEPEILATNQLQVTGSTDKNKILQVRMGLSGVVSKKIAQEKKAGTGL
jgi:Type II secretion system (T2SS), protein M subtype b